TFPISAFSVVVVLSCRPIVPPCYRYLLRYLSPRSTKSPIFTGIVTVRYLCYRSKSPRRGRKVKGQPRRQPPSNLAFCNRHKPEHSTLNSPSLNCLPVGYGRLRKVTEAYFAQAGRCNLQCDKGTAVRARHLTGAQRLPK